MSDTATRLPDPRLTAIAGQWRTSGHVIGAKHLPLAELEAKLPTTVKNKALPLIFVCANGANANKGVAIARKLGYEHAHALTGGMGAWRTANLPVEKA